jgi:hypothetical protein
MHAGIDGEHRTIVEVRPGIRCRVLREDRREREADQR